MQGKFLKNQRLLKNEIRSDKGFWIESAKTALVKVGEIGETISVWTGLVHFDHPLLFCALVVK